MNDTAAIAKHYGRLTPEERFKLILAAAARGDDAEKDRLASAAKSVKFSMQDYSAYVNALDETARLVYTGLLEETTRYYHGRSLGDDALAVAFNALYCLKMRADGWRRFCEQLNLPLLYREVLPGPDSLRQALARADKIDFSCMEPGKEIDLGLPEITFTAENVAAGIMEKFRERLEWWGQEMES